MQNDRERFSNGYSVYERGSAWDHLQTKNVHLSLDYADPVLLDPPAAVIQPPETIEKYENLYQQDFSYGVVIDCGSSGSRIFAYFWPQHSGDPSELLKIQQLRTSKGDPVVKKITPGIATFGSRPHKASTYLKPLLEYASLHIPQEKHKETPLYILCTAGMRMLAKRMRNGILTDLQTSVPKYSKFQFLPSHAEIISGMTEGLYFWMGLNYALGNLNQKQHLFKEELSSTRMDEFTIETPQNRTPTVGVIDMGGASLQVAIEVTNKDQEPEWSKQTISIDLGCDEHKSEHEYRVYVETFLHKGGNAVRKMYEHDLFSTLSVKNLTKIQPDPCLPLGLIQSVEQTLDTRDTVTYTLNGTGNYRECRRRLISYLEKSSCDNGSNRCVLSGKYMPPVNYRNDQFFGSSEFFYCMDDVLGIGGTYQKQEYDDKAQEYCATPWGETWNKYENGYFKNADENRVRFQCFKSAWVSLVLHEGLNIPNDYKHLTSVKYINNSEIQWTLGAILYKTRFLPLREIQFQSLQSKNQAKTFSFLNTLYYPFAVMSHNVVVLVLCIAIVIICLLLSIIRFCLHHNTKNVASLRRVGSSVAYFMHEGV